MLSVGACSQKPLNVAESTDLPREPEPVFGGEMFVEQRGIGNAPSVVFIHGIGDNAARDWDNVIPAVSARYHTIAFDLPGFGRSDRRADADYSPHNYARVLDHVIQTHARKPVVLVGHSMGAAVALYYAAQRPDVVQRLILVDAAGILQRTALLKFMAASRVGTEDDIPFAARAGSWLARLIEKGERFAGRFADSADETRMRRMVVGDTPASVAGAALMDTDFSMLLPKVTMPTFLIWGERDRIAPLRTGQVLAEWLPRAQLVTIPAAAHVPMTETPERARELIESFLAAPDPAPRAAAPQIAISDTAPTLRCDNERDTSYTGTWSKVEIVRCTGIELKDVIAREVVVQESQVTLLNAHIAGGAVGLTVERSELNATNLRIDAEVALQTSGSRHDLAGVELIGARHAIASNLPGYVVCSLCTLRSGATTLTWHDVVELKLETNY